MAKPNVEPTNPFLSSSFEPKAKVGPSRLPPLFAAAHAGAHKELLALLAAEQARIETTHPPFQRLLERKTWPAFVNVRLDGNTHYKELPGTHGGPTLLHLAAGGGPDSVGHLEVMRALLEAGTDPTVVDDRGRLATHVAAAQGSVGVLKLLVRAGCGVDARQLEPAPDSAAGRRRRSSLMNGGRTSGDGSTALHLAAAGAHLECVRFLLFAGATPDIELMAGQTASELGGMRSNSIAEGKEEEGEESDDMAGTGGDFKDDATLAAEAEAAMERQMSQKAEAKHGSKEKHKKHKKSKKKSKKGEHKAPVPSGKQRRRSSITGLVPRRGALASDLARKVLSRRAEPARLAAQAAEDQSELIEMLGKPSCVKEAKALGRHLEKLRELRAAVAPLRCAELRALACAEAIEQAVDAIFEAREAEEELKEVEEVTGRPGASGAAGPISLKARLRKMSRATVQRLYRIFNEPHERSRHEHFVQRAEQMRRRSFAAEHERRVSQQRIAVDGGTSAAGGDGAGRALTDAEQVEAALAGEGELPLVVPRLLRKWGLRPTVVQGPDMRGGSEKLRRGQRPRTGMVVGYRLGNGAPIGDDPPAGAMCANVVWAGASRPTCHLIGRTICEPPKAGISAESAPVHELRFACKPTAKRAKPRLKAFLATQKLAVKAGFDWEADVHDRGARGATSTGTVRKEDLLAERHKHARKVFDEDEGVGKGAVEAARPSTAPGAAVDANSGVCVDAVVLARLPAAVREKVLALAHEEPCMAHVSTARAKARVALLTKGRAAPPAPQVHRRASRLGSLVAEEDQAELKEWLADRLDKGRRESVAQERQEQAEDAAAEESRQQQTLLLMSKRHAGESRVER